jgi:hypothetical protein
VWGKEEARESREGEETYGVRERKEAEKEGNEGQVSSACQENEVSISRHNRGRAFSASHVGVGDWMTEIEERKARVFMEMRGYEEMRRSELEGVVEFLVKTPDGKRRY